jgi:hypothetical protein
MAERSMKWVLTGEDRSASSTLGKAATAGESASHKIGSAFQKLGGQLGGEFGEVLNKLGEGFEKTGEKGLSLGKKFAIGGAAVAGVGALLTMAGSKEKQATDQLKAAVDATGASYSDYSEEIEKTVKHEENFAHSAADTKTALQTLTQATGDTQKALDNMQLVTDLAAARHISLADAAGMVAKILGGGGGKTLIQYGIHMKTNADGTKDVADALDQLQQKLSGQASASMDNFGAKVAVAKTKLTDFVGEAGQKIGPALTIAGTAASIASGAVDLFGIRAERAAAKELALAAAEEKMAASSTIAAAGSAEVAAGNEAIATSSTGAATGLGGLAAAAARVAIPIIAITGAAEGLKIASDKFQGDTFMHDVLDPHNADVLKVQGSGIDALRGAYSQLHGGVEGTAQQLLEWGSVAANATIVTKQHYVSTKELNKALAGLDAQVNTNSGTFKTAADISAETAQEQAGLADQINKVKSSALSATAVAGDYNDALTKLSGDSISAAQQELALKDALDGAKQALKGNGSSLSENTAKGRANKEWLLSQIDAVNQHSSSVLKQTGSVNKATAALGSDETALRRAAIAAGLNKDEVDALIRKYAAVPSKVQTLVDAKTEAAQRKIRDLQYALDRLKDKIISVDVYQTTHQVGPAAGGHLKQAGASGISSAIGGRTLVGELGPEIVDLPRGSRVYTNSESSRMLGGGGNVYVTVNAGLGTDPVALRRTIIQALADAANSGQTIPILKALR